MAVDWVGEPEGAVFGSDDVVGGVEGSAVVVVYQRAGVVRHSGGHGDQGCGLGTGALRAEDEGVGLWVVAAAVREVGAVGSTDFVPGVVGWGVEGEFCYHGCFLR